MLLIQVVILFSAIFSGFFLFSFFISLWVPTECRYYYCCIFIVRSHIRCSSLFSCWLCRSLLFRASILGLYRCLGWKYVFIIEHWTKRCDDAIERSEQRNQLHSTFNSNNKKSQNWNTKEKMIVCMFLHTGKWFNESKQ